MFLVIGEVLNGRFMYTNAYW